VLVYPGPAVEGTGWKYKLNEYHEYCVQATYRHYGSGL